MQREDKMWRKTEARAFVHSDANGKERTASVIVYNCLVNPPTPQGMLPWVMREDSGLWGNISKTSYKRCGTEVTRGKQIMISNILNLFSVS